MRRKEGKEWVVVLYVRRGLAASGKRERREDGRGKRETRNGRADQALRRDGFGFEGWHNVEGGGGRIGGWLSN